MLASERKRIILARLEDKGCVSIDELCELIKASESTLRRDLTDLENLGKLVRVYGGAELIEEVSSEASISEKALKNIQEKEAIASMAVSKVKEDDVIYLDAGTSTGMMIPALLDLNTRFTVVTNSVTHASALQSDKITVYILGGIIKYLTDAVVGSNAIAQLEQFNFTKAFLGANAISNDSIMTPDIEEANIKRSALKQSKKTYILADQSKFNQVSFVKFADLKDVVLLTNNKE